MQHGCCAIVIALSRREEWATARCRRPDDARLHDLHLLLPQHSAPHRLRGQWAQLVAHAAHGTVGPDQGTEATPGTVAEVSAMEKDRTSGTSFMMQQELDRMTKAPS